MPKRTSSYHSGLIDRLRNPQAAASYLRAAMEDSREMFLVALRNVAEARQMSKVAETAKVSRESLYRMLSRNGNPTYNSLDSVLRTVGLKLSVEPVSSDRPAARVSRKDRVLRSADGSKSRRPLRRRRIN